jgi:predicted phosphodiesterase
MDFVKRYVPNNFNIFFFGDVHIGTLLHNESGFKRFIAMVNKPYDSVTHNILIGMGDYIEAIDHSDNRFDVHSVDLGKIRPDMQIDHFKSMIEPIKSKIIVLLEGNHEYKLVKYFPYVQRLCSDLKIPYGTYTAVVSFCNKKSGNLLFKVYATHGYGTIRSVAGPPERQETNMKVRLKDKLQPMASDCAIMAMGHTHRLLVANPISKLCITSGEGKLKHHYTSSPQNSDDIHPDHRWYLNTGSFLRLFRKGISGYAERAMYPPMEQGFTVVKVRNGKIIEAVKEYV